MDFKRVLSNKKSPNRNLKCFKKGFFGLFRIYLLIIKKGSAIG